MGTFLHKLWDETLAGPTPDAGLKKLRKYHSFSGGTRGTPAVFSGRDRVVVTRSIRILKGNDVVSGFGKLDPGSFPESPLGSSNPGTPLTPGTPSGDFEGFSRTKSSSEAEMRSPTGYDWIMICALDR